MIELRWLLKDKELFANEFLYAKRVLQYRQQIQTTNSGPQWSDWQDVPEV